MIQPHENENRGAGTPGLEAVSKNLPEKYSEAAESVQSNSTIDPTRLRYLARRVHALGERPLCEYLCEVVAGANALERLEVFARLDPAIVAALGGAALPLILTTLDGGRQ